SSNTSTPNGSGPRRSRSAGYSPSSAGATGTRTDDPPPMVGKDQTHGRPGFLPQMPDASTAPPVRGQSGDLNPPVRSLHPGRQSRGLGPAVFRFSLQPFSSTVHEPGGAS